MRYKNITEAVFKSRPNRFIARVVINGEEHTVHVKNTGRCRELLVPGCRVYLEKSDNPTRKTLYDLVSVEKAVGDEAILINMDSQVVNDVAKEWLKKGFLFSRDARIRREYTYGDSRFDFYIEDNGRRAFLEVKGVTLECGGEARFPDAPTARGEKHLRHLIRALDEGYEAYVLFIIQMKGVVSFTPNVATDPKFSRALSEARAAGVGILAIDCRVEPDSIEADSKVPVIIGE
ncbi:MAG: DNA/RNA nuclease SfsA [Clostridia bacterium]|nr:DNA/RNA nuclease SfsA [Clostridia bacterium]